jgi:hypothetical protein
LLAIAVAGGAASAASPAGPLLDHSRDRILRRADIISRGGKHGEVRLVERSSLRVVQTLLYSKLLHRVVAEIRDRESGNWPAERPGHDASARYVAELERAEQSIARPGSGERGPGAERRRPLLIEFVLSSSGEAVLLLEPRVEDAGGELVIVDARLIVLLELPRDFVEREMRLIAEEHFSSARDELAQLLAPPGPAEADGPRPEDVRDDTP